MILEITQSEPEEGVPSEEAQAKWPAEPEKGVTSEEAQTKKLTINPTEGVTSEEAQTKRPVTHLWNLPGISEVTVDTFLDTIGHDINTYRNTYQCPNALVILRHVPEVMNIINKVCYYVYYNKMWSIIHECQWLYAKCLLLFLQH